MRPLLFLALCFVIGAEGFSQTEQQLKISKKVAKQLKLDYSKIDWRVIRYSSSPERMYGPGVDDTNYDNMRRFTRSGYGFLANVSVITDGYKILKHQYWHVKFLYGEMAYFVRTEKNGRIIPPSPFIYKATTKNLNWN